MAFVVTRGELANVDRQPSQAQPTAMYLTDQAVAEYAFLWRTQPAIRTVVTFLARNIASLPLQVFQRRGDNDRKRITEGDLARIIGQPQPGRGQYSTINSIMHDLGIYDRAYRIKVRGDSSSPRALVRGNPRQMRVIGDSPFAAEGYLLRGTRGWRTFRPAEVVHWHGYNPEDDREGCSPIESLRQTLMEEYYSGQFREQLWRNGARISGYLKRPAGAPDWYRITNGQSESARDRFARDWRAQYSAQGPKAGGTPILEDGMEWVPASVTPEQAQALEQRKLSREEVASAYFIQPTMLGMLDHATFSNVKEQHKQLYQDTLGPWLALLEEGFDLQLVPDFGGSQLYVEFNLSAKLAGSFEERAAVLQTSVGAPYLTRNEARAMDNRAPIDGGDELITPLNVLVGGQASPTDSAPPPKHRPAAGVALKARPPAATTARAEKTIAGHFERQGRAIVSALGAEKSRKSPADIVALVAAVFDRDRWDGELAADLYALNVATSSAAAGAALRALGWADDRFDASRTLEWLQANAERVAGAVNGATAEGLTSALADVEPAEYVDAARELFAGYASSRAPQVAKSQTTSVAGFGTTEVARQAVYDAEHDPDRDPDADPPEALKTWITTSDNPRPSHAALNGSSVPIDAKFANGGQWPGDSDLPDSERAGCTCDVTVEVRA